MKEKTRKLQFLHKGMATLLLLLLSTIGAWATDVVTTYSYESSASKAVMTANDYFSAASNPTATAGEFANDADKGLKCTLAKNTSGTVTFTFTAKASVTIESFTFNSCGSSNNILNATVDYYKNSETPASKDIKFNKSSLDNSTITPDAAISLANGDVLTIKVNLSNTDTEIARNWFIKTISLTPAAASTYTVTYDGQTPDIGSAPTDTNSPYAAGSNVTVLGNTGGMTMSYKDFVGWNTSTSGTVSTHYNAGDTYSSISSDVTFYAVWHNRITYSVAAGQGSVSAVYGTGGDTYYGKSAGNTFTSGDHVPNGVVLTFTATPATGYHFDTSINKPWGGTGTKDNPITWTVTDTKGFDAHFAANIYTVTIDENTGTAGDASVTATYDAALPAFTAPTKAGNTLSGYYTETSSGTKVINADGTLATGVAGYTDGSGNWKHDGNVTLYAQWTPAATYTVIFNGNSHGTPASASITQASSGASITLPNCTANTYYNFLGWSTSPSASAPDTGLTAGSSYTPGDDITLYAVYTMQLLSSVSPTGGGTVVMKETNSSGSVISSGDYVSRGQTVWCEATPATGYTFSAWTAGYETTTNPVTFDMGSNAKTMTASFTAKTYSITLNANGGSAAGSATATYKSNALTSVSAPTYAGMVVEGYYKEAGCTNKIADASGNLQANTTYTDASGNWTNDGAVTLYAKWEAAPSSITDLPVTIDFGASPFSTSTDFSGASGKTMSLTQNSHEVYFHGSNQTEFSIVSGSPNALRMNSNGATNHFIAIPMSGINGRIDIEIWAPYAQSSNFTIRAVLDTDHGTTVQSAAPSAIKTAALDVNDYKDGHFYFRMKDLTATEGVLYIGPASSSYKDFQEIRVTSPAHYLIPDKASVTMGDASDPETVTITNYSSYPVLLKTVPSCVTATFDPSTGVLVVTPKSVGTGNIEFAVDTDGDGIATSTDLSIPVTVTGITNVTAPTSAVYDTSSGSYSPALAALSVTATKSATGNTGTLAYQWYSNTVNSNTGGTVISGATSNTLSTDKISTTDSEKAAFYYCVVSLPGDSCKSVASDVAYVLTSKSKRYFHMSNVAGNRQTSDASEKITGEIVAGGTATAIHGADSYYRYITRPSSSYAHMYVVSNANNYIKINLDKAIATDDVISVLQMGNQGTNAGIKIATDASGSNAINIYQDGTDTKTYSATFTAAFNGVKEIYILGKYAGYQNYFTDLYISKPAPLAVSAPTPASQEVGNNEAPNAITVIASGGTGNYTYQWQQCATAEGTYTDVTTGTGGTTASYTPAATTTAGTTYYKCIVTSGGSNVTSSAASVTVSSVTTDYYTSGTDYTYTDGKSTFDLTKDNYTIMYGTSADRKYWYINGEIQNPSASGDAYTKLFRKESPHDLYMKSNRATTSTFYVKGAAGFKIVCGSNHDSRTYILTVDGVVIGSFNPSTSESEMYRLDSSNGSYITIDNPGDDIYISQFIFYEYYREANTISIQKDGETVTTAVQYTGDSATEYEVETNSDSAITLDKPTGAMDITDGYRTDVADVTLVDGILRVTPRGAGSQEITVRQAATSDYEGGYAAFTVTVKKHTLKLAFSYDKASFKASALTSGNAIPPGSLPTLTATVDGEAVDIATLGIRYQSDEPGVGRFDDDALYTVTYGGDQGGARIYAYVDNRLNPNVNSDKAYFDLVVEAGTSNALPSTAQAGSGDDKEIYEQKQFRLANSQGVEVVRLTYGGYKYAKEGQWANAEKKGDYFIDGYAYYTRHGLDAFDEYGYQIKGMEDEAKDAASSAKSQYSLSTWSSQNVGNHSFWYTESEGYGRYERIRPFCLPTRGGYLKFEPKQTGKLTVYVWQNGTYSGSALGSKPRLGYWFDQDGWVQHPTTAPITKQPLSDNMGSDHINLISNMDKWTALNDDDAIKKLLINKWCSVANPNEDTPVGYFSNEATKPDEWFENPYYWLTEGEIDTNLDEDETVISKKMVPVPYHNGYMVPEASYLKYKLNVVAGKTYYFYGMMTKIGYVGMNFVEDDNVTISDTGKKFYHETSTLHLNANDNMETVVANSVHGDATTYLGSVYDEVTLPSNYKKGQWSTICLPFALSENQVEEAFGKGTQLTIYNGARKKGTGVYSVRYLSHVDRNILAGQPYFIKPSGVDANGNDLDNVGGVIGSVVEGADEKTRITFNTVCIDKTHFSTSTNYGSNEDVNASGTDIDQYGYEFVGAYANEQLPKYSYVVSGGKLRQFTGSTTRIPTYYAYLKPHTSEAISGSFSLQVDFNEENVETTWADDTDDDPTGVISMEAIADAMNNGKVLSGKAYNMMGQEVDPTSAKGIVIIDGKKYMFK